MAQSRDSATASRLWDESNAVPDIPGIQAFRHRFPQSGREQVALKAMDMVKLIATRNALTLPTHRGDVTLHQQQMHIARQSFVRCRRGWHGCNIS
jgi:hypothetical protein